MLSWRHTYGPPRSVHASSVIDHDDETRAAREHHGRRRLAHPVARRGRSCRQERPPEAVGIAVAVPENSVAGILPGGRGHGTDGDRSARGVRLGGAAAIWTRLLD